MKTINRSAIAILGTEPFLAWIKQQHPSLHRWTLDNLNHHPNIYLVDPEDQNCWGDCFEKLFEKIFRNEVGEFIYDGVDWPSDISPKLYRSWFRFEYIETVYDLSTEDIRLFDE